MKNILISLSLLSSIFSFAGNTDSTFQRHQFSVSMTNGISATLHSTPDFGSGNNGQNTPYFPYTKNANTNWEYVPHQLSYIPDYALHLNVSYSIGLSKLIRLETGLGYMLQGKTLKYSVDYFGDKGSSTTHYYQGSLLMPVHIAFTKAMHKGSFICAFGPNFSFPVHQFYLTSDVIWNGVAKPSQSGHDLFSSNQMSTFSTMGFDIRMAYQKKLSDQLSLDIGPSINFVNIVLFHDITFYDNQKMPLMLNSVIGLNVALNFGLKQ